MSGQALGHPHLLLIVSSLSKYHCLVSIGYLPLSILAQANLQFLVLLATGASPLGDMPQLVEMASLGLLLAPSGEDPFAGSASSSSRRDHARLYCQVL